MVTSNSKQHFPQALMSASREEFYGQDTDHAPLALTVKVKLGNRSAGDDYVDGTLPEDLQGHVFIIGPVGSVSSKPATREDGDPEQPDDPFTVLPTADGWTPLFNGDGMIYRLDFHRTPATPLKPSQPEWVEIPGKAWLITRLSKPPDFFADQITASYPEFQTLQFNPLGLVRFSPWLGFAKQINTAFLPIQFGWQGNQPRLLATNDASRPYEVDPFTLKVIAPVGLNREWNEDKSARFTLPPVLPDIDTSGHPCFDPVRGEVITVNLVRSLQTILGNARLFQGNGRDSSQPRWQRIGRSLQDFSRDAWWSGLAWLEWLAQQLGLLGTDALYVNRWIGKGALQRWQVMLPDGKPAKIQQLAHMLGLTENYIVVADTAIKLVPEDILPNTMISQFQTWLDRLEQDLDAIGAEEFTQQIQAKYQELLRWIRQELSLPQLPDTMLYIIPRQALNTISSGGKVTAQPVTVPGAFYHFLTDYDETSRGNITLQAAMAYATDSSEFIHGDDQSVFSEEVSDRLQKLSGSFASGMDLNNLALIEVDPKTGTAQKQELSRDVALQHVFFTGLYACADQAPTRQFQDVYWFGGGAWEELLTTFIDDMYQNYQPRNLSLTEVRETIQQQLPVNLCHLQIDRQALANSNPDHASTLNSAVLRIVDSYHFPQDYFANSPQFIPSTDPAHQGYIVCAVIHSDQHFSHSSLHPDANWSANSELWIFAANHLHQGPLYKLSHPKLNLSLTLHSTWLRQIAPAPDPEYDIQADYDWFVNRATKNATAQKKQQIQDLFAQIYRDFEKE
jgi:hypothetical protein